MLRCRFVIALLAFLTGCASTLAPQNDLLTRFDPEGGYRFATVSHEGNDGTLIGVSFSGGGTRAAALSYGVLEELSRTQVTVGGQSRRLLDLVETISSVSGGSYTAAYYGLFGDRIFSDFEPRFLKRNVQSEMLGSVFNPVNLFRMSSPFFGRSNIASEYLDDTLFEHKTFADLLDAQRRFDRPYIQINATDMGRVSRFEFSQEQFDLLCADLSSYRVSSAVVASSAVPVVFSPISLKNYAGQCGYTEPAWMKAAAADRDASLRRYHLARDLESYLDADKRRFVHLIDGGLSDNLGLRGSLDRLALVGAGELFNAYRIADTRRLVQIVVNAQARIEFAAFDQRAEVPSLGAIAFAVSNATDRYSIETLSFMRVSMNNAVEALKAERRALGLADADDVKGYLVEVNFDALADADERDFFNQLPTTFHLPDEAVDRLREVAGRLLRTSPAFKALLRDLH